MTSPHAKGALASSNHTMGIGARGGALMADFKGTFIVTIVQSRRRDTLQCYREVPEGESERASEKKEKREREIHTHT